MYLILKFMVFIDYEWPLLHQLPSKDLVLHQMLLFLNIILGPNKNGIMSSNSCAKNKVNKIRIPKITDCERFNLS